MVKYTNKLPGLEPEITADQVKQFVFNQHPEHWRITYTRAGRSIHTDTLAQIVQFMANEKNFADTEDTKKKRKAS
eukprot:1178000-Ditylum_brightwellii.AAC.1